MSPRQDAVLLRESTEGWLLRTLFYNFDMSMIHPRLDATRRLFKHSLIKLCSDHLLNF